MNGGWQTITEASGQPFANQGQCVAYAIHHPVSLADLAGSVVGTGSGINVSVTNLDGNAAGAPGTETYQTNVGLQSTTIISCPSSPFNVCALGSVSGTFTITTSVGTLSGIAAGELEAPLVSDFPRPVFGPAAEGLGLTVTSATGEFTGTTGTLTLEIPTLGPSVEGTVFGG
jgi:hypothetical protein